MSFDMNTKISVSSFDIENTHSQKLLGITIDRKLNFHDHVFNLCKKASANTVQKMKFFIKEFFSKCDQIRSLIISVIARVFPFILLNQRKLIMKAILMSQFGYCPLVWIYNRALYNRINSLHEKAFRLVYNDFKSSFHQLLEKDHSVTIHQSNLQTLTIEISKVHNNIAAENMKDVFEIKNHKYNFRRDVRLQN